MKILLLAPHPFYQPRGTPIAVDLLLRALSGLGHEIDVVTFPEGEDREYPNVRIHRARTRIRVSGVRPSFSLKKLYCDWGLYAVAEQLLSSRRFDLIHAIEEAAFFGARFSKRFKVPFVYDMDSLMSAQLADRSRLFALMEPALQRFEARPMTAALAVAPMCQDLADRAAAYRDPESIFVLKDVSLLNEPADRKRGDEVTDLRATVGNDAPIALYVGNLERYQGVDLLLEALRVLRADHNDINLVFIGGAPGHIAHYKAICERFGISSSVYFLGPRPVADLGAYLRQADVLVSPRTHGTNTPMKIYSYLHSGVPVLATRLPTHTQVMNDDIALLADPEPAAFAAALAKLAGDPDLRARIGARAREYAAREHGYESFVASVEKLYRYLEARICASE